jgi:V/A-type H+-transporting ATPase subunit I
MIQKMKKFTFLVTGKEYEQFISDIRELGVLHIDELQSGATSDELQQSLDTAERYKNVIKALDYAKETYETESEYESRPVDASQGKVLVEEVEKLLAEEYSLKHKLDDTEKAIGQLEPWGNFDREPMQRLAQHGCNVYFFVCPSKAFARDWVDNYFATPVSAEKGKTYFLAFASERPDITAECLELPTGTLASYIEQKKNVESQLGNIHEHLVRINAESRESILAAQVENENSISLSKVRLCSESIAGDAVKLMVGWTLEEKSADVTGYLETNHIFYEMEDPKFDDNVPIQLKNDSYSRLFEPILRMYSLPNYSDLDPTPYFAPFFMLFFGLCMCDAGYGLLILLASFLLKSKLSKELKGYANLGMLLGGMTVVCGGLTGSFLGIDLTKAEWAFLAPIRPYFVNEANFKLFGYSPMMVISVIIGFIQVLLGMLLAGAKAAKLNGWRFAVGKVSWVLGLFTTVICFGLPFCGVVIPTVINYILYGIIGLSVLGIFFYNSPDKNIFKNFGTGIWDTYGMATGLLGDLLSYIRLFALGLTGGVLGGVFNELATTLFVDMPWAIRWLPMLLVLLAGHGINFALCMISSFVHPMRLTFVEFFKNASFDGGGKEYSPFKIRQYKRD